MQERETVGTGTRAAPEPGVAAAYRHALGALGAEPATLGVMALLNLGLGALTLELLGRSGAVGLLGCAVGAALATPLAWTLDFLCLRAVRGDVIGSRHVQRVKHRYADLVAASVLVGLLVTGGLFLLVVPGVVLYVRLRFVPYLLLDEDLPAGEALRQSLELTRGGSWPIFWISLLGLVLFFAGLPVLVVGAALGDLVGRLATASFYHATVEGSREHALRARGVDADAA